MFGVQIDNDIVDFQRDANITHLVVTDDPNYKHNYNLAPISAKMTFIVLDDDGVCSQPTLLYFRKNTVFVTHRSRQRIRMTKKMMMTWLLDHPLALYRYL
jgi:hypothetical protein